MISSRPLNVGILGCGPISQAAHFESANKARNATLYAICDVADDLRARMAATHAPQKSFASYEAMLNIDVPRARQAFPEVFAEGAPDALGGGGDDRDD